MLALFLISCVAANSSLSLRTKLCGYGKAHMLKSNLEDRDTCLTAGKTLNFGEDAGFFDENRVIIADGVGGWRRHGVDPSHFSFEVTRFLAEDTSGGNLVENVKQTYENVLSKKIKGSTTVGAIF